MITYMRACKWVVLFFRRVTFRCPALIQHYKNTGGAHTVYVINLSLAWPLFATNRGNCAAISTRPLSTVLLTSPLLLSISSLKPPPLDPCFYHAFKQINSLVKFGRIRQVSLSREAYYGMIRTSSAELAAFEVSYSFNLFTLEKNVSRYSFVNCTRYGRKRYVLSDHLHEIDFCPINFDSQIY